MRYVLTSCSRLIFGDSVAIKYGYKWGAEAKDWQLDWLLEEIPDQLWVWRSERNSGVFVISLLLRTSDGRWAGWPFSEFMRAFRGQGRGSRTLLEATIPPSRRRRRRQA